MRISEIINRGQFKPEYNYVVIIDGCRVADHSAKNNKLANQYNFIHYHLTRMVCKNVLKKYQVEPEGKHLNEPVTYIPDFTRTLRPREILHYHTYDSAVDSVKRDITLNYLSSNNPIIRHFIEKLKEFLPNYSRDPIKSISLCKKINNYTKRLNYDKILRMAYVVDELFNEYPENQAETQRLFEVCFNQSTVKFKQENLTEVLDNLLDKETDPTELSKKFDIDIVISMIKRYNYLLKFIDLLTKKGAEVEEFRNLPKLLGNDYLTSNIFYKVPRELKKVYSKDFKNTFILNCGPVNIIMAFDILKGNPQDQIIFHKCDFRNTKVNYEKNSIKKLVIIKCSNLKTGLSFNPIIPEIQINSLQDYLGSLKLDFTQKLTIKNTNLDKFFLNCANLTYLDLELTNNSSLEGLDFLIPKLETLILKANELIQKVNNFNIEQAPRIKKIHLENLDFTENTVWNFSNLEF